MSNVELKPCPMCGAEINEKVSFKESTRTSGLWLGTCDTCDSHVSIGESKEDAIKDWNLICRNCKGEGICPSCKGAWLNCDKCKNHKAVCSACKGVVPEGSPEFVELDCYACQDEGIVQGSKPRVSCVCQSVAGASINEVNQQRPFSEFPLAYMTKLYEVRELVDAVLEPMEDGHGRDLMLSLHLELHEFSEKSVKVLSQLVGEVSP